MHAVERSPQAEADLEAILEELERRGPAIAERFAADFAEKGRLLGEFPELGRDRSEIAPELRSTLVSPYVIFYRVRGETVQILRILHGKRDLIRILRSDDLG